VVKKTARGLFQVIFKITKMIARTSEAFIYLKIFQANQMAAYSCWDRQELVCILGFPNF